MSEPVSIRERDPVVTLDLDGGAIVQARQRDDVPPPIWSHVERDDVRATTLHLERQEAARRSHIEHSLACEGLVTKIGVSRLLQIPVTTDQADAGNVHAMVEETALHIGDDARRNVWLHPGSSMGASSYCTAADRRRTLLRLRAIAQG